MKSINTLFGIILLTVVTCLSLLSLSCSVKSEQEKIRLHKITIIHPGDPKSSPMDLELIQQLDSSGNPVNYSLWVDSVICRDEKCAVVKVKLNWDSLGNYQSYEVEKGEALTKLDHVPFTEEDHKKLQSVLKDKDSPLKEVTKEGLTGKKSQGVDGVSGATVLTLGANVVLGAGYTCYDLWHWANGKVCHIIEDQTGKDCSESKLVEYLNSKNEQRIEFALTNLDRRNIYRPELAKTVLEAMKSAGKDQILLAMAYLKKAQKEGDYLKSLSKLFEDGNSEQRLMFIESLNDYSEPPMELILGISQHISILESYQELHRFLTYLEKLELNNEKVKTHVSELLSHKKFFYSRRAYWFLEKQELSDELKQKVNLFKQKYEDRL